MFCAVLGYLQAYVAEVYNTLVHTMHFMAEHKGILAPCLGLELLERYLCP